MTRARQTILLGLVLVLFAWIARPYLPSVVLGGLLAIVLHPVQRRLAPRIGPARSAFALTIGVLAVAVVPLALLALHATSAIGGFLEDEWPATAARLHEYLAGGPLGVVSEATDSLVQSLAGGVARLAGELVIAVPNQVIQLFLLSAGFYYLVLDGPRVVAWLERASPFSAADTAALVTTVRETTRGVLIGVVGTGLVQGGLTTLALLVFGVPAAVALGILAGLLSIVPMLGTTPVTVGAVIYLASGARTEAAVGMTIAALLIGVSDNLVRPYLMHVATPHQHPLLILLGVFGGATAFGAPGVFVGPVLAALAAWAVLTATARTETERPGA
jgi:predicted PurR-regulated permease PerM